MSLLTDFGARDPSAAICRGVVLGIAPDALVVDISHEVEKYRISHGALLLWCALPYLPLGAHVAVVDPGVGTDRRAVALETARGDFLVGPDNGLLLPAAERVGGVTRGHLIENARYRLPFVSSSFHGRDVFAPAAAHLATGVPLESLGRALDPADLVRLDWGRVTVREGELETSVIYVDTFGNLKLTALASDLVAALGNLPFGEELALAVAGGSVARRTLYVTWQETFGRVKRGEALLYEDSYGRLCLAVNQVSAADTLGLREGLELRITRRKRYEGAGQSPGRLQDW